MPFFSAADLYHGANAAWNIYQLGWNRDLNASRQYQDFWNDVRSLAENLGRTWSVVENAQDAWKQHSLPLLASPGLPSQKDWDLTSLREIIGDYYKTLTDCENLLRENPEFRKNRNFVYNIEWNLVVQPKVEQLRKRLEFHNTKILVLLKPLELTLLSDIRRDLARIHQDLANRIDAVHQTLLQLKGLLIQDVEQALSEQERAIVLDLEIPAEIENKFQIAAERSHSNSRTTGMFPLQAGADAFVQFFKESTKSFTPRGSFLDERTPPPLQYLALLKCVWIMRCLSACEELRTAPSDSQWHRYVHQLEENLWTECQRFKAPLGQELIPPDLSELRNDEVYDIWPAEKIGDYMSRHTEEKSLEEVLSFPMPTQSRSLHRDLKVHKLGSTRYRIVESIEDKSSASIRREEQKLVIDLKTVNFTPLYAIPSSTPKAFKVHIASEIADITPMFLESTHIFSFQHLLTGYKVFGGYDQAMVTVSFTISGKSETLEEHGRLQLWLPKRFESSSTVSSSASNIIPSRFGSTCTSDNPSVETMPLANNRSDYNSTLFASPTSSVSPFSQYNPPFSSNIFGESSAAGSFRDNTMYPRMTMPTNPSIPNPVNRSGSSISTGEGRESMTSSRPSSFSTPNKLTKRRPSERPPSITPSTKTISSVTSRTSVTSITTVSTDTGKAHIHAKPAKPLLVIFLKSKKASEKFAIVAIQIDEKTLVERERCKCRNSKSDCRDSCIERLGGGNLLAQRWDSDDGLGSWNLARLGVHQRKELPEDGWENLKRVKLKFDTLDGRFCHHKRIPKIGIDGIPRAP
ncbi:hypothetical protein NA56DRAFT_390095 [Hyaloscypha hepaticicola]|uniref:Uncharacterized protein n=1 Tax=Hyaloscypha hepaticicola TaxID=2082293 RepID=A0A2J6QI70_9HELO|nr:hypothetical protein NA56DRAFT_390095 [Hyaloscypha hepaticicola]